MSKFISKYIIAFFIIDVLLILAHLLGSKHWLLHLDIEYNIPTLFAGLQVLLVSLVSAQIFFRERSCLKNIAPGHWIWLVLSASFAYLAIDDVAQIHERVFRHEARDLLPPDSIWISLMPWQIIFGPFLALVGIILIVVVLTRFSQRQGLFLPAVMAISCWILAVVLEGLSKPFFMVQGWYELGIVLEEGLELFGGTLFLLCFARYAQAIEADYRPESFSDRTGYAFFKASLLVLLVIAAGAFLVFVTTVQNSAWLYRHNGGVLAQRGQYDRARVAFKQALTKNPTDVLSLNALGTIYAQQKNYSDAMASYQKSLQLHPNQPLVRRITKQLEQQITNHPTPTESRPTSTTSSIAHVQSLDDPRKDGWTTEAFAGQADKQLKLLGKIIAGKRPITSAELVPLVGTAFVCNALLPENHKTVFEDSTFQIQRGHTDGKGVFHKGTEGLAAALNKMLGPLESAQEVRCKFKIFRVNPEGREIITKQYFACSGRVADNMIEQNSTWVIRWSPAIDQQPPLMQSIEVENYEMVQSHSEQGPLFADCSEAILKGNDCYRPQLLRGINHWLQTSQRRRHLFRLGTPGIAVADVNGDGLEDLYLCQEVGLPNRLFLHQADNTALDVSKAWGVDWLHDSRSALFFDWDNDGDQDLAVSVLGGVILAKNNGQQGFQLHKILPTSDDTQSLCAADYDQDGDLDLYVCVYRRDKKISGEMTSVLPSGEDNFVYHDANTGGPGSLFRNDGGGNFTDATDLVGLNQNNHRYSYAAVWEDFDNDGDVDLYVANDFGRDNLYQNNNGKFSDIAETANVEDSASGMAVTCGDYDHDGWMDIFVSNMWSSAGNRVTHQPQFKAKAPAEIKKRIQRLARGNTLLKNNGADGFSHVSSQAGVEVGRWAWGVKVC